MRRPGPPGQDEESRPARRRAASSAITRDAIRDIDIVAALRRGESSAYETFITRFHRVLLEYARRGGVRSADCDEFVDDLLDDIALQFMTPATSLPQNPRMYVISAFRKKLLNLKRARGRRERVVREAVRDAQADCDFEDPEHVVAGCSEGRVRESHGPGWESSPLPQPIERLSAKLSEALSDDERQLLVAVADNVPQREIAEWLGVSHVVARKRLERLRARLTDVAMRYAHSLEPDDARELQRFFKRCRARIGASLIAGSTDDTLAREA